MNFLRLYVGVITETNGNVGIDIILGLHVIIVYTADGSNFLSSRTNGALCICVLGLCTNDVFAK